MVPGFGGVCLQRVLRRRERPEQRVRPSQQAQSVSLVHNDCGAGEQRHPEFGENALLDLEDRAVSWQQVAEVAAAGIRPVWHEYGDRYRSPTQATTMTQRSVVTVKR